MQTTLETAALDTLDQVTSLAAELVRIPGMNPMGKRDVGDGYGEAAVGARVAEVLRGLGFEVDVSWPLEARPNVVGFFDCGCPSTILFESHLDTVPAGNMTIDPFGGTVRDGRLWGRGSADVRGPMAAMLAALGLALDRTPAHNLMFAAVCDEEYQFGGIRHLLDHLPAHWRRGLAFAVVAEPTDLNPVIAHKGLVRWTVTTHGVAAHSSTPDLGENAIYRMAPVVRELEHYAADLREGATHPALGAASLSVGTIAGGSAVNVVPDRCVIEVDRRLIPGECPEVATDVLCRIAGRHGATVSVPVVSAPAFETQMDSPPVRAALAAARTAGLDPDPVCANYCTDATFCQSAGIASVVFGPGSIAQAHAAEEWISLSQLELGTRAYAAILTSR